MATELFSYQPMPKVVVYLHQEAGTRPGETKFILTVKTNDDAIMVRSWMDCDKDTAGLYVR